MISSTSFEPLLPPPRRFRKGIIGAALDQHERERIRLYKIETLSKSIEVELAAQRTCHQSPKITMMELKPIFQEWVLKLTEKLESSDIKTLNTGNRSALSTFAVESECFPG